MATLLKQVVNLDDLAVKRRLMARIGTLRGLHEIAEGEDEIRIKRRHRHRSLQQNAAYWTLVIPAFQAGVREEWREEWKPERCHEELLKHCSTVYTARVHPETGEVIQTPDTTRSSSMETKAFSEYWDRCCDFIAYWFHVVVPPPDPEWRFREETT